MAPPPAKRQKRNVVLSSEDDEVATPLSKPQALTRKCQDEKSKAKSSNGVSHQPLPTRLRMEGKTYLKQSRHSASLEQSLASSAERPSGEHIKKSTSKGSLHAYLSSTSQTLPTQKESKIENLPPAQDEVVEDIVDDDSADELLRKSRVTGRSMGQRPAKKVSDRRKPLHEQTRNNAVTGGQEKPLSASQRFLRVGKESVKEASTQTKAVREASDTRPWAEKYGPVGLEELMVHKKKVADVRGWLESVSQGRSRKRLLILKGPSGAGKTATISALANALKIGISEWKNPVDTDISSESYLSMSAQFEDFLGRSGKFGSLSFSGNDPYPRSQLKKDPSPSNNDAKKLILIEEFPSIFSSTSLALRSFRTSVLQYIASNSPSSTNLKEPPSDVRPVIMIITETTTSTSSSDSFTAHRLLGPSILSHPATTMIEFNPIAPTLLLKALELILQKDARHSLRRRVPGPAVLKNLAEIGDVRSAIGSLEFLCLHGGDSEDWSGTVASKSKKSAGAAMSKMEERSLELVSQRESSLGLFHAVGKVVYNKREEPTSTNRPTQPPDHLPHHVRLKVSEVALDTLIDETGTDPRTFIATLHENYLPSCEGSSFIDHLNDCIDALSDAELLSCDHSGRGNNYQGKIAEELRQDEIAFQLAVRGILFALPYPVKRATHPVKSSGGGGGGNRMEAFKMRYPTSMRIARQMEETDNAVERWCSQKLRGANDEDSATRMAIAPSEELLLESLPYVAKIQGGAAGSELEKIIMFRGVNTAAGGEGGSEDEEEHVDDVAKDRAMMPPPPPPVKGGLSTGASHVDEGVGKLYLSDDDIEDV